MPEGQQDVRVGASVEACITDWGVNGEGIAHVGGTTLFVPYCLPGERVLARVVHAKRGVAYGALLAVLSPSADRVDPLCPLYGQCGGCNLAHLSYEKQLQLKREALVRTLQKSGLQPDVADVVPSPPTAYRNKIQLPFGVVGGKTVLGFYREGTHEVVPLTQCRLHGDWATRLITLTLEFFRARRTRVRTQRAPDGVLRHLVARYLGGTLTLALVINADRVEGQEEYAQCVRAQFPNAGVYVNVNRRGDNVILGAHSYPVGEVPVTTVDGLRLRLNPHSFFQVNDAIRTRLYAYVQGLIPPGHEVIDAYAGVGLLGAKLAQSGTHIHNIEIVPEAVEDGKALYAANGLAPYGHFHVGDAALLLPRLLPACPGAVVVLDPPRKGLDGRVVAALNAAAAPQLVYVSCNPATLARDLAALNAYAVQHVRPFDMFPNTPHLETLVVLSHKKPDGHIGVKVEFGEGEGQISLKEVERRAEERKPKEKVTYKMIQDYIEKTYGFKVHTAYIAEVKRSLGLPMYDAPNAVEELKRPRSHPSPQMVEAIKETLKHFEII